MLREFNLARDYDAVLELWRSAGPGVHVGASDTREETARKLERDPDLFLVAEDVGRIVGTVIGGFDGRRGMVYHLAVAPEYRGRGIGTALMNELETRLKAKGCLKYYLQITSDNVDVVNFYEQIGWQRSPHIFMSKTIV